MTETCSTFSDPRPSAPIPRRPSQVAAWVLLAFGALAVVSAARCTPPGLPPVSGCSARAQACVEGEPAVCSASGRWHRSGDLPCSAVGGVCVERDGIAFCAPAVDAGHSDAAGATEGE